MNREVIWLFFPIGLVIFSMITSLTVGITFLLLKFTNNLDWRWWKILIPIYIFAFATYCYFNLGCILRFFR